MLRAVCCVVALVACGPRGTSPSEPHSPDQAPADAAAPMPPVEDAAPTTVTTPDDATVAPPVGQPPEGTAAYCLYVGAERFVVRCYWTKGACTEQAAFNKDSGGSEKSQECRGVAQAYCYTSDKSERCYPTSDDCDKNVASMRQHNRAATDCVAKTGP